MKIGIIGAMEVEVDYLKKQIEDVTVTRLSGMEFFEGTLGGVEVVVVKCGIGKVNAAACAQAMAGNFGVTHVINTGIAGSLDNRIDIGDIVVSTDAVHHDVDVTNLGYERGQIPGVDVLAFPASAELRVAAVRAVREDAPEVRALEGRVASGDQFVCTDAEKERITSTFGALCCEMEGASIAQVCYSNDVPFVIVRAISDKADGSSHVDYPTFERDAARHCARIVERVVGGLAR